MAPWFFSALCCSWKRRQRPLSSGVVVPQTVIIPTEVAQTGNADDHVPAPVVTDTAVSPPTGATCPSSSAPSTRVSIPGLMDITTCAYFPQGDEDDAPLSSEGIPKVTAPTYCLNPTQAREHVNHIDRFCIFVVDRANAGKTTILQRLCNSMDQPEIFDGNGRKVDAGAFQGSLRHGDHRIEYELAFKSDPHYVFHDSCGFEAGSEEQFNMKKFVIDHANMPKLEKWIHAIWFCILLSEGHRMITIAERNFFDECDTGHVPVIVLLMKAGTLEVEVIQEMEEQQLGVNEEIAAIEQRMLDENLVKVKRWLNELRFPPHDFLPLRGKCSTIAMIYGRPSQRALQGCNKKVQIVLTY